MALCFVLPTLALPSISSGARNRGKKHQKMPTTPNRRGNQMLKSRGQGAKTQPQNTRLQKLKTARGGNSGQGKMSGKSTKALQKIARLQKRLEAAAVLGEVIIHLDMDADRNGSKQVPGSNQGGVGRFVLESGLGPRMQAAAKASPKSPEGKLLSRIITVLERTRTAQGIGEVPANGALARRATRQLVRTFGKRWMQNMVLPALRGQR